jgi:hypothetical protein
VTDKPHQRSIQQEFRAIVKGHATTAGMRRNVDEEVYNGAIGHVLPGIHSRCTVVGNGASALASVRYRIGADNNESRGRTHLGSALRPGSHAGGLRSDDKEFKVFLIFPQPISKDQLRT